MNRPLLIGQAPGPNTDPTCPLFPVPQTSAGGRLKDIMGLSILEYCSRFERVNLLPYFPGQHKRDDKFPMTPAKLAASVMRPLLVGRSVIVVGRNVANAFGLKLEWHEWATWQVCRSEVMTHRGVARVAVVPHPSGRNRWYTNTDNRAEASAFWDSFLGDEEAENKVLSLNARRSKKTAQH